jgi:peptidoglycan/xylan/chitin deacetylase (PgdA/CDA1 family)
MTLLRRLPDLVQPFVPAAHSGAIVLAYHLIGAGTHSSVDVPLSTFQRQLDVLMREFSVVPLSSVLEGKPRGGLTSVVLTFDDAYLNFAEVAWPELRARRLPCTLYAPVGFVQGARRPPITGTIGPPCTMADLRTLQADGVEIGSHGCDHLNLRRVSSPVLERELTLSRDTLQAELKSEVTSFCYPQAKYDARVVAATRKVYRSAVVAGGVRFKSGSDPLRIPRFPMRSDQPAFEGILRARVWLAEAAADRVRQLRA